MREIDTSAEGVERLASDLEEGEWDHAVTRGPNPTSFCAPDHPAPKQAAATLRALAAERDALHAYWKEAAAGRDHWITKHDAAAADRDRLAAENARLRAGLETIRRGDVTRIRSGDPELGPIDQPGHWAEIANEALAPEPGHD